MSVDRLTTTSSVNLATSTEETSINPSHNTHKGFPYLCSCGGDINLASVQDRIFDACLCFVYEYIGDGGNHVNKYFDEAVQEEINWTQKQIVDHEDRLSRVEMDITPQGKLELSREITKIFGMLKSLREDLELLDLQYRSVYDKCASTAKITGSQISQKLAWMADTRRISFVCSVGVGFLLGYLGHRHIFPIIARHIF